MLAFLLWDRKTSLCSVRARLSQRTLDQNLPAVQGSGHGRLWEVLGLVGHSRISLHARVTSQVTQVNGMGRAVHVLAHLLFWDSSRQWAPCSHTPGHHQFWPAVDGEQAKVA